jgi:peptidoglycan hydrolase-like protein with peptidoglycan-binding domain
LRKASRIEPRFVEDDEDDADFAAGRWFGNRKDMFAAAGAALAALAIAINALFLQHGSHPAPIFASKALRATPVGELTGTVALPRPRPADGEAIKVEPAAPRTRAEIVGDIQRELARRGFYDGATDGVYGPKTDAAIRDFEQATGVKAGGEPSDAMLQAIARAPAKAVANAIPNPPPRPSDPIGELIAPPKQVTAVQRALAEYGYGQIRPTGVMDANTRAAIEQFERTRKIPVTGQISPRLLRELSALTGRPLE